MATFLALYRGDTVATSKLIAVTAEPALVRRVAARMLDKEHRGSNEDVVVRELGEGAKAHARKIRKAYRTKDDPRQHYWSLPGVSPVGPGPAKQSGSCSISWSSDSARASGRCS